MYSLTTQLTNKGAILKPSSNSQNKFRNKTPKKSNNAMGEIRLIAGQWRGRRLKVHDKEGLRPTTDRLKETLFNWLMTDVRGANVLDCFSGSGSLGFEAASRFAKKVVCIEKNKQAAQQLRENANTLNAESVVRIISGDFFQKPELIGETFDVIFIDPPFNKSLVEPTIIALLKNNLLKKGAILYVEQEKSADFKLESSSVAVNFELLKSKDAGQVCAQLFRYKS